MKLHYRIRNFIFASILIAATVVVSIAIQNADSIFGGTHVNRYLQHKDAPEVSSDSKAEGKWNTHLPLVCIETNGVKIPGGAILNKEGDVIKYELAADGSTTIPASVTIFEKEGVYHQPDGKPDLELSARIRIRGNTSRLFDKKSYKLNFFDNQEQELPVNVMGMGAHDEWALYGPFLDKTLLRNYLFLNLYGEIEPYTPDVRFCEVILNGDYQGLYVLMETVSKGAHRVDLASSSTRKDKTAYIVRVDKARNEQSELGNFTFYTNNPEPKATLSVVYPGTSALTEPFRSYIEADFSAFEKALYSYDFKDPEKGYRAYIDVASFVDYYIMSEFLLVNDVLYRSTYFYKDLGGKLHIGPGWDYNNTANNFLRPVRGADGEGFVYAERTWYKMLLKDEYFVDCVIKRYRELRDGGILDAQNLTEETEHIVTWLGDAIDRNFEVWGYSFDASQLDNFNRLTPYERNPTSYEEALSDLREFLRIRGIWMDENIESLQQYSHVSMIKLYLD
jgi:hypothetical protein